MSDVILFDPRGVFSSLDYDLIRRHQEYIAAARKQSNGELDRLVIFTKAPKTCPRIYSQGLIEIHGLSSTSFFSAILKKNTVKELTLGDFAATFQTGKRLSKIGRPTKKNRRDLGDFLD